MDLILDFMCVELFIQDVKKEVFNYKVNMINYLLISCLWGKVEQHVGGLFSRAELTCSSSFQDDAGYLFNSLTGT